MHIEHRGEKSAAPHTQPPVTADPAAAALGLPLAAGLDFMLLLSDLARSRTAPDMDPADLYGDFA